MACLSVRYCSTPGAMRKTSDISLYPTSIMYHRLCTRMRRPPSSSGPWRRAFACATIAHAASFLRNQRASIASYFSHVLGRSKSAKLASTGHAGLHAPQSISWVRFLEACFGFFSGVIVAGMSDYRHKRHNVSSSRICCTMSSSFCWGRGLGLQRAGPRCGVCTRALWRRCPPRVGLTRRRPLVEEIIRLCRKFCSGGHEGAVAPVCVGIKQRGHRTVRPQCGPRLRPRPSAVSS